MKKKSARKTTVKKVITKKTVSKNVSIVEVGLRDGLQNEAIHISHEDRLLLAERLVAAGVRRLELGAFVRTDRVPQMQGSLELIQDFIKHHGNKISGSALVPNMHGMQQALASGIREIAIFGSCSETFAQKNINCSIEESFERFAAVVAEAKKNNMKIRGYLSCCFSCPYEGKISPAKVVRLAQRMYKMGCYEISIGDTIGVATPNEVSKLMQMLKAKIPVTALAGHFHDTRGTALANIMASYALGVRTFDSSIGGLGGCPYAPGAAGNVATEDVVYMLHGSGIKTGLNLAALLEIDVLLAKTMQKQLTSKLAKAGDFKPRNV